MNKCVECGSRLKVTITGGEFFIRDGSTLNDINFEKVTKTIDLLNDKVDDDVMLEVHIQCTLDPTHDVFAQVDTAIRAEIYKRINAAAMRLYRKYFSPPN